MTYKVRGLLCGRHNFLLRDARDVKELTRAMSYLRSAAAEHVDNKGRQVPVPSSLLRPEARFSPDGQL
ncbi:MAG: hypothetical protein ABSG98_11300 [Anaerolineales bacterium]|jgi:hypothetical protein